jgi:hypothetical protein
MTLSLDLRRFHSEDFCLHPQGPASAGEAYVFDAQQGCFVPASIASHSGSGPYQPYVEHDGQIISG